MTQALDNLVIDFDASGLTHEEAALALAERGFCVFPLWGVTKDGLCRCGRCSPTSPRRGKHPILRGGFLIATTDPAKIHAWWLAYPDANIGLPTGMNGLFVVDVDPAGRPSWEAALQKSPELKDTLYIRTGRGYQAVFRQDPDTKLSGRTNGLGDGLDTRGEGNYVIAPPSRHYTGRSYTWANTDKPIAPLPPWLFKALAPSSTAEELPPNRAKNNGYLEYDLEDAREILAQLGQDWYNDRDRWLHVAMALKAKFTSYGNPGLAAAWELFDSWSSAGEHYNQKENWKQWTSLKDRSTTGRAVTFGTIIHESGLSVPETLPSAPSKSASKPSESTHAPSSRSSSLSLRSIGSLLQNRRPIPPDLIPDLLPAESTVLFSGHGGVGKSYILLDLCIAGALNRGWMGRSVRRGLRPLYVDLENKDFRIAERVDAILRGSDLPLDCLNDAPITFSDYTPCALDSDELPWIIAEAAQTCDANLIILDSLADFLGVLDENSNSQMAQAAARLRAISTLTGATVIIQHHVSKGAAALGGLAPRAAARGASALFDDVEVSYQVLRDGDRLILTQDKNRVAREAGVECALLWWNDPENQLCFQASYLQDVGGHVPQAASDPDEDIILECLDPYPAWTQSSDVVTMALELSGKSRATIYRKVQAMIRDRVLEHDKSGYLRRREESA